MSNQIQAKNSHSQHSIIALTGFMGSGKNTVGRALAARLGWTFVDLDAAIEKSQGRAIPDIFRNDGEEKFRAIEAAMLRSTVKQTPTPYVLATGGGTFVQPQNAELLRACGALVIFLEASPETLLLRCRRNSVTADEAVRPLARDPEAFLRLYEERLPFYRTAHLSVDSDNQSPEAAAEEIAETLQNSNSLAAGGQPPSKNARRHG